MTNNEQTVSNLKKLKSFHNGSYGADIDRAIKALEQEPILDKIRAEIDKERFVDKCTMICKNANASGLEVAMQIIDKYKAESEG